MQPAVADRVHSWTVPASTATTGVRRAAIRSFPWWLPPGRGSPKSSEKLVFPTTGNTIRAGDAECATAARDCCAPAGATRTRVAAARRIRAVVRGKRISGGARKRLKATKAGRPRCYQGGEAALLRAWGVVIGAARHVLHHVDRSPERVPRRGGALRFGGGVLVGGGGAGAVGGVVRWGGGAGRPAPAPPPPPRGGGGWGGETFPGRGRCGCAP